MGLYRNKGFIAVLGCILDTGNKGFIGVLDCILRLVYGAAFSFLYKVKEVSTSFHYRHVWKAT
jgi:hypothetical protein